MSGALYFCSWWRCRGVKLAPHGFADCPHFAEATQ